MGKRLERAMRDPLPSEGIRIRVTLRNDDLEAPGLLRRNRIRGRQDRVLAGLDSRNFSIGHRYQSISGLAGRASAAAIEKLRRHPEVESVHLDARVFGSLLEGVALVGGDTVQSAGFTGAGITVAVIDTGFDSDHSALAGALVAEQCFCSDSLPGPWGCCPGGRATQSGPGSAEDDNGHGTQVSGTITSNGTGSPSLGISPGAGIVAIKVLDNGASGFLSDIDKGLDWVLANYATYQIRVVNMSLGDGGEHNTLCTGPPTQGAVTALNAAGIVVFAASGNEAHNDGIADPACVSGVIAVGGVYDAPVGSAGWGICSDNGTFADKFVCHTNSDELLDIVAPNWRTKSPKMGGGQISWGGTSAASPYAAGMAALLLERDPTLQPASILSLLQTHGPLVTDPGNGLTFRRPDIEAAIASLAVCGNGVLEYSEQCDDGGTVSGDCCSATCTSETAGNSCNDGSVCTTVDQCDGAGSCVGSSPLNCDDANLCTTDSCDSVTGCANTNNTISCTDGNACTTADICSGGACVGGAPPNCDDANLCTSDSCDTGSGCVNANNTLSCDDSDACTTVDICSGGSCVGGTPPNCDDANLCTTDFCDSESGCLNTNNTISCTDGDACTTADTCAGGSCVGGSPPDCNDANLCTTDSCDSGSGCINANNTLSCDDTDACTTADTCAGGSCVGGTPPDCNDANLCTTDSCDSGSGCINANNTITCDDSDACTTADTCAGGSCLGGTPPNCDDANLCTTDSCDSGSGCLNTNNTVACDDSDACTTPDVCSGGACLSGAVLDCNDGNPCTAESCDGITGCAHDPIPGCVLPAIPTGSRSGTALLILLIVVTTVLLGYRRAQSASR
jgi:hypothetical protein